VPGCTFAAGAFAARLAGALLVATSFELQLDEPSALIKITPASVSPMRPGVQKDLRPEVSDEEGLDKAIWLTLSRN
jgi:hypothetical protein